ncbi:MAG: TolC family protein [Tannerella sp.]|jgi:outer membrane protein TolC|nr:TolC family protein [Tannerella sp.]
MMKRYKTILLFIAALRCSLSVAVARPDSLNHYLEMAARNNPGLQADFTAYQAALQRIPQTGVPENPQLELGFFLQPMELVEGRQVADIKLMQMFPWFGTRKAARTEAQHMAKMAYEQFRETRDGLFLEVYTRWFTLGRLRQQLINNQDNRALLLQLEELALHRFAAPAPSEGGEASGRQTETPGEAPRQTNAGSAGMGGMNMGSGLPTAGGSGRSTAAGGGMDGMAGSGGMNATLPDMSDVLRIRMEIAGMDYTAESLRSEIQAEKAKFNALLNRPADSDVHLSDSLQQIPFLFDLSLIRAQISERNPMLGMLNEEEAAYRAKAEMDRKMSYPMLGVGLQYMLVRKKTVSTEMGAMEETGMNRMNGKDMLMPMVSISLPVYRKKHRAQQRENALLQQAVREKRLNARNLLEAELHRTGHLLNDAARRITLYRRQTELARAACNLALRKFSSGRSDLAEVIQLQRQLADYALKTSEAVADYNIMVATVQKLMSSNGE